MSNRLSPPRSSLLRGALAVAALLVAACTGSPGASGAAQGVGVSLVPRTAAVRPTAEQRFTATVTGTADTSVSWQVSDASCGTVSSGGVYTAPAANATCHVVVTSNADPTKSAVAVVTVEPAAPLPTGDTVWAPLKIGAGGFITGIDVDPTGATYVVRTDTYGAYVGAGSGPWQQLVTAASVPTSVVRAFTLGDVQSMGAGAYEIRVAPADPNTLYMLWQTAGQMSTGYAFKSTDRGTTWTLATTGYDFGSLDANSDYRTWGQKMAVDPANPDVVYAGGGSGLYVTTDGGGTWGAVSASPAIAPTLASGGTSAGITGIVFDPSSGTSIVGGQPRTNGIWAVSNGQGAFRSTDAGATWSLVAGGPTQCSAATITATGVYLVVGGGNTVYRYAGGAWATTTANPSADGNTWAISADPFNASRVVLGRESGELSVSTDAGATFSGWRWNKTSTSTDIPWLQTANGISSKATAQILFDPVTPNKLWLADGIGVWYADPTPTTAAWRSVSAGIEQLVGRDVLVPPGSAYVFTAGMDRALFRTARDNASYPSVDITMGSTSTLIGGWALSYAAANPQHVLAIVNGQWGGSLSGYSLDGGATWTRFPAQPASGTSGDIVAPSIDSIIAVIGTKYAYRSTDRGVSWTRLVLPGDSGADTTNLHCGYNCKKRVLAVDGVDPNTVYLYFYRHGIYRSTDAGATWSLVSTNAFDGGNMYWQVKLRAVPGQPGHLFLTAGQAGGTGSQNPQNTSLYRSTDGGVTWTTVPGMAEPYDVALGKAAPGASYPAIYVAGWYNGVWGIWRSIDDAATWTSIGQFPFGSLDEINAMSASQDVFGDVYVAFQGSGWGYGTLKPAP